MNDTRPATAADAAGHDTSADLGGARLFPIGFGLGAVAALALFFGYRAVVSEGGGTAPDDAAPTVAEAAPATTGIASEDPSPTVTADAVPDVTTDVAPDVASDAALDTATYAATDADIAAADTPALAGIEELASLSGLADVTTDAVDDGLPRIDDPATSDLFGGSVVMVSSTVPRVIVLADGTSLVPGERLPSGHRIVDIRRERILLERDGVEWRLSVP